MLLEHTDRKERMYRYAGRSGRKRRNAFTWLIILIIFSAGAVYFYYYNKKPVFSIDIVSYYSGPLSGYGELIRSGALLARRDLKRKVHLNFIDAGSGDIKDIARNMQDSSSQGALLFIDSPLAVALADSVSVENKTIMLCGTALPDTAAMVDGLFVHSVAIELQVVSLAEKAWNEGFRTASVSGNGNRFQNLSEVFKEKWLTLGGGFAEPAECVFFYSETGFSAADFPEDQTILTLHGYGPDRHPSLMAVPLAGEKGTEFVRSAAKAGLKSVPDIALVWDSVRMLYQAANHSGFTPQGIAIGLVAAGPFELATGDIRFENSGFGTKDFQIIDSVAGY